MRKQEGFAVRLLPANSAWARELCEHGLRKHYIKSLIEIDVTDARHAIKAYRNRTGRELSFFSWIVKCIADAVSRNNAVHACRFGRSRVLVFDEVDISIPIEREVNGKKMPMPYVLRMADKKSVLQIEAEVTEARTSRLEDGQQVLSQPISSLALKAFPHLPGLLKAAFWRHFDRDPFLQKRIMGTVGITSVAIAGKTLGWALPISVQPLCFALGSVTNRTVLAGAKAQGRNYLALTVMFDHDVVDGAPASRVVSQLSRMAEQAYGLQDLC